MTTYGKEESFTQSQPLDPTSEAISHDRPTDRDRFDQRIRELKAQGTEILRQVQEQRKVEPKLPHLSLNLAVDEFYEFFDGYIAYFFSLSPDEVSGHGCTYESVLSRALDNTRQLWQQLSLAINQRYNPVYAGKLAEADAKAARILGQIRPIVQGMPILYFDKLFQISRHPYQTYPLLGVSPDCFEFDTEASLAHELGHHVFWNNGELEAYAARLDFIHEQIARIILAEEFPDVDFANPHATQRAIRSRFDQYTIWIGWIEEVFADVFGALVIGPQFAKSAQDVLIRERVSRPLDLLSSDGEHPIPALRPFIASSTLKAIAGLHNDAFGTALNALAEDLEVRWQPIWIEGLDEEGQTLPKESVSPHPGHADSDQQPAVTLEDIRKQIPRMVELVLTKMQFQVRDHATSAQGQAMNLLTAVEHWGKQRSKDDIAEIQRLRVNFAQDPVSSIENRVGERVAVREFEPKPKEENPFDRFRSFVEKRLAQTSSQPPEAVEVWQAVLEFDLALDHGYHPNCKCHCRGGDQLGHKHVGIYHTEVLCS